MNPFYQAMRPNNLAQQFQSFVQQMKGKDPNAMLNELVSSGRVSQQQLDAAQQKAREIAGMFRGM